MPERRAVSDPTFFHSEPKFSRFQHHDQNSNIGDPSVDNIPCVHLEILLKVLTPTRLKLLEYLRNRGAVSIRKLSKEMERDYSNIYKDVQKLKICGLIAETHAAEIYVPWNEIVTRFT